MNDDQLKRLYYSREEMGNLLRAVVGIFDHSEVNTVRKIAQGRPTMERTSVLSADLHKLIMEVEELFPGMIDDYINFRLEQHAVQKYGKKGR